MAPLPEFVAVMGAVAIGAGVLAYVWGRDHLSQLVVDAVLRGRPDAFVRGYAGQRSLWPALGWTLLVLALIAAGAVIGAVVGRRVFFTRHARGLAGLAIGAAMLGTGCAAVSVALVGWLTRRPDHRLVWAVQGFGFAAVMLLTLALPVALCGLVTAAFRACNAFIFGRKYGVAAEDVSGPGDVESESPWAVNQQLPPGRQVGQIGVCVSGGGIRSAAFCLGALQRMQALAVLSKVRYLIGVSGGGYAVGAMRLALNGLSPGGGSGGGSGAAGGEPPRVFADGSPEFHHVRRHSKYLADGVGQWLVVLGVVLRGVIVVQLILLSTAMLAGRLFGQGYAILPDLRQLIDRPWPIPTGLSGAVLGTFGLAIAVWLVGVVVGNFVVPARAGVIDRRLEKVVRALGYLGLAMLAIVVVLPTLVWLSTQVMNGYHQLAPEARKDSAPATTDTVAGVLAAGYLASLVALFTKARRVTGSAINWARNNRSMLRYLPARVLHWLLICAGMTVLVIAHVYVFARVLHDSTVAHGRPGDNWPGLLPQVWTWVALGVFLALALCIDQTRWSLHPFYKERLMTAFVRPRTGTGASQVSLAEDTSLADCAAEVSGFPQVILVATANVSGQSVTPPGRRALPYSLAGDWIGSPRLGWIKPDAAWQLSGPAIREDLTMAGAMAISGAAFASAMGASGTPYTMFFAMTNVRLGTWLPNPYILHQHVQTLRPRLRWHLPRLPYWRRLQFLIREVIGAYPWDGRLLLATDGGHYDNLGLVELLRHFPSVAYCFDASCGSDLETGALSAAISLAHEELGIRIDFDNDTCDLEPGCAHAALVTGAEAPAPCPDTDPDWQKRLARTCVLTGTIRYPDTRPHGTPETGRLYLGKAVLTGDAPWEVKAFGRNHPAFPNDRTSDQWFDHHQFDAYHALGQYVADRVIKEASIPDALASAGVTGPGS